MTTGTKNAPVEAGTSTGADEQILKTNSAANCISELLDEADRILIDYVQDLLDNLSL